MSIGNIMKKLEATNSRLSKESIVAKVIGTPEEYEFFDGVRCGRNTRFVGPTLFQNSNLHCEFPFDNQLRRT